VSRQHQTGGNGAKRRAFEAPTGEEWAEAVGWSMARSYSRSCAGRMHSEAMRRPFVGRLRLSRERGFYASRGP
jgi:hypothetical protein